MLVEIGALVHKSCGPDVLEALRDSEGVAATFIEPGRSNDLFDDRQFGEFGEAAISPYLLRRNTRTQFLKSSTLLAAWRINPEASYI